MVQNQYNLWKKARKKGWREGGREKKKEERMKERKETTSTCIDDLLLFKHLVLLSGCGFENILVFTSTHNYLFLQKNYHP